jgi:hypothetical protein
MIAIISQYSISFANAVNQGFHGIRRDNVMLDPIESYDLWPAGDESPLQTLCESESKTGHYHVFQYERQIAGSGFRPTGKNFGGLFDVYPRSS